MYAVAVHAFPDIESVDTSCQTKRLSNTLSVCVCSARVSREHEVLDCDILNS